MSETAPPTPRARGRFVRLLPLAIVALLIALAFAFRIHEHISIDTLRARRLAFEALIDANLILAIAIFVAVYVGLVWLSLPVLITLSIAGGFLFGTWLGGGVSLVAATVGATLVFLTARTILGEGLRRRTERWLSRFEAGMRENAFNYLLAIRLIPAFPFWIVNLAAAFFEMRLRDYVIATVLGTAPIILVFASVGAALHKALEAGASLDPMQAGLALLFSPHVIGPLMGLAALALAPALIKRLRRGRRA